MTATKFSDEFGNTDLQQVLTENVGMSSSEAKVYIALVQFGKQSMTEIADHSEVPKQRVYNIVDGLRTDGFVEVVDEYPKKAYAIDPTETIEPLIDRLYQAEDRLEALYEHVEEIEGGISLFKSRASVEKHIREVIEAAEKSVFLVTPLSELETFRGDLARASERGVRVLLIVSNLPADQIGEEEVYLDESAIDAADRIRGIKSNESFILTADREEAFLWTDVAETRMTTEEQGFRITNPELAFTLDRFIDQSLWPLSKPVADHPLVATYPERYLRMRDCLADLKETTETEPLESSRVEIAGYDVETRDEGTCRGTLVGYHYSPFDRRAYMEVDADGVEGTISVGGWKATLEDFEAREITVEQRDDRATGKNLSEETASHAADCRNELPAELDPAGTRVTFGFDGFVDRVREMVDVRHSGSKYDRLDELGTLGDRISRSAASDTSFSNEWLHTDTRCGGHTSHLSRAFDRLGYEPTLIGAFGQPIEDVFREEFDDCEMYSYGEPTVTDAVEFSDGKLLLQDTGHLPELNWETLRDEIGIETLVAAIDGTTVLGIGYWANAPSMPSIWDGLRHDIWPRLDDPPSQIFIDPADIRQLSPEQLQEGIPTLSELDELIPVTVSANRVETAIFAKGPSADYREQSLTDAVDDARKALGVTRFIGHSPVEAALSGPDGTVRVDVPRTNNPELTTSAGDHFNTGVLLAQHLGLSPGASLVLGNALAGYFVRTGEQPTYDQLRTFVSNYETKFD